MAKARSRMSGGVSRRKLVLTPFEKALTSLEEIVGLPEDPIVRDATIQRFEYTYELARKMMKRHLTWFGDSEVESLSWRELFREAARIGLLADAELWFDFNEARNLTSHTYDEQKAEEVYVTAKNFAVEARRLLDELKKHHG